MEETIQESKAKKYVNQQLAVIRQENKTLKMAIKNVKEGYQRLRKQLHEMEKELELLRPSKKEKQQSS